MTLGGVIRALGGALFYVGVAAIVGIFLVVLLNRHWPTFLKPVQHLFAGLSHYIGGWAFPVEIFIFIGPGLVLIRLGDALQRPGQAK
jgi:hypothetical protein